MDISHDALSGITDRVVPLVKEWQSRQLEELYCIVWLDAMHYKVKDDGKVKHRAVYNVLGINQEGRKDLLGVYVSESEGANFWLSVLTDLQNRGVKDILIACIDNLNGFEQAILSVFPKTEVQTCVVHQIRNSLKYVVSKDQKEFMGELKSVYKATTKELAELNLEKLGEKWGKKYPLVMRSWQENWPKLSTFFKYSESIRRIIYTTNTIEGFHRQVRKVTKTKGVFPSDEALLKLVFLAYRNISKKWTQPLQNWGLTVSQLAIHFEGRLNLMCRLGLTPKGFLRHKTERMTYLLTLRKEANSKLIELAHSNGSRYSLKSCSSAELFSASLDLVNVINLNADTV